MPGAVVVGTGFGCRVHVPALRAAGFDGARAGRARRGTGRGAAPSGSGSRTRARRSRDALALGGVDAVTIAAPPDTHAALAIEACAAGRHVICEKPFALDAVEAERDARRGRARRRHASRRPRVPVGARPGARRAARSPAGVIGEPRTFSLVPYVPLVADPEHPCPRVVVRRAARGGGWLGASGSHVVDQVRTWFGEIASVSAALPDGERPRRVRRGHVRRAGHDARGVEGVMQQTRGVVDAGCRRPHDGRGHRRHDRGRRRRRCACPTATGRRGCSRSRPISRSRAAPTRRPTIPRPLHAPRARSVHAAVRGAARGHRAASDRNGRAGPDVRRRPRRRCGCSTRSARRPPRGGAVDRLVNG